MTSTGNRVGSVQRRQYGWLVGVISLLLSFVQVGVAEKLALPPRPLDAPTGSEFVARIRSLQLAEREAEILFQVTNGNIPDFQRRLCPIEVSETLNGKTNRGIFYVTPDYVAVGTDTDYFLAPISPGTGQRIADALGCCLPTRKMVDAIYAAASVKLKPSPIPPTPAMTTVEVFAAHNATVWTQRQARILTEPLGALVAGHKKDIVISSQLPARVGKVAIYGWHRTHGEAIQPLYLGHTSQWVDYSQCTRLAHQEMLLNGTRKRIEEVLTDPDLASLLSDEGPLTTTRYPTNLLPIGEEPAQLRPKQASGETKASRLSMVVPKLAALDPGCCFGERVGTVTNELGVRIHINAPPQQQFAQRRKVLLVLYALPNGNTIEQTIGKELQPGDDWHFNIQHIGAQTRFLRERLPQHAVVVAYLENELKSWPTWRKQHGDEPFVEMIESIKTLFAGYDLEIALNGHSGGGSLIFGYLNTLESIPAEIVRIGFLDSNYAYNRASGHTAKLVQWLKGPAAPHLCVLAYNDAAALLDGKPFVSAAGGTWGRSQAMLEDLAEYFEFTAKTNGDFRTYTALNGRLQFILRENPERKVYHTVQVERNGFIHSMVSGTTNENRGYEYFGPRAYSKWISSE